MVLVNPTEPDVRWDVGRGTGELTKTNVVVVAPTPNKPPDTDVMVLVNSTEPLVCVVVRSVGVGVGILTRTNVVVVAATPSRPPWTEVMVLVKAMEPLVWVRVWSVGVGVGELTRTNVVVVAPTPNSPPWTDVMVLVNNTEPLVCVMVVRVVQNGSTVFRQLTRLGEMRMFVTPLRKQLAAAVSPNVPRAAWQTPPR
jgi:hypothetical protein